MAHYIVGCLHGVNQSKDDLKSYAGIWQKSLEKQFKGDTWECVPIKWESTGTAGLDWFKLTRESDFYTINHTAVRLQVALKKPDFIIAHSMGTVVALDALRHSPGGLRHWGKRLLGIGSPITHPIYGPRMVRYGMAKGLASELASVPCLYNKDDDICALRVLGRPWMLHPKSPYRFIEIKVPGVGGFASEHDPRLYLEHTRARSEIARICRGLPGL